MMLLNITFILKKLSCSWFILNIVLTFLTVVCAGIEWLRESILFCNYFLHWRNNIFICKYYTGTRRMHYKYGS
jgi:hypothetical protein